MGRLPDPINGLPFPEVWRKIRDHHKDHWEIRLRPAANLIGYYLFPVGWHWSEFKTLTKADKAPYEKPARDISNQKILLKRPLRKPALACWKAGRSYRKNAAKQYLEKILVRGDLKYFCGSMRNLALPNRGARPIKRTPNRTDFYEINVAYSTVGQMISQQVDISIDANDLVELLIKSTETRGAPSKYGVWAIERWCRNQLERNTSPLQKPSNLRASLINATCDWQGETNAEPAGPDQVRPIVDKLLLEYCIEE